MWTIVSKFRHFPKINLKKSAITSPIAGSKYGNKKYTTKKPMIHNVIRHSREIPFFGLFFPIRQLYHYDWSVAFNF